MWCRDNATSALRIRWSCACAGQTLVWTVKALFGGFGFQQLNTSILHEETTYLTSTTNNIELFRFKVNIIIISVELHPLLDISLPQVTPQRPVPCFPHTNFHHVIGPPCPVGGRGANHTAFSGTRLPLSQFFFFKYYENIRYLKVWSIFLL